MDDAALALRFGDRRHRLRDVVSLVVPYNTTVLVALQDPSIATSPTTINPRLLASTETAVIAGLLLLLYVYRRRQYILWWMWGWLLLSAATLLTVPVFSPDISAMLFGGAQLLRIVAALLFVVAVDAYRQKPII